MTLRTIAVFAFAAFAFFGCRAGARADQIFCAPIVSYVTPATPYASADATYLVLLRTYGAGEITHAKLAVLDGNREYEINVPVEGKYATADELNGLPISEFRPLTLHFSKPISLQAIWIENVGDDRGDGADCLPDPSVPTQRSDDSRVAKVNAELDARARHDPLPVSVPQQEGLLFLTPENCRQKYVDAIATTPVVPQFPEMAKNMSVGRVTVLVRVNIKPDGELASAFVQSSSDNTWIDKAALVAAERSKYAPKKINCIPFAGTYLFRATFDSNM